MDPFNMQGLASNPGDTSQLQSSIGQLAPMADAFHGPMNPNLPAYAAVNTARTNAGFLPKIENFLGSVASTGYHTTIAATKWLGSQTIHLAESPLKYGAGIAHGIQDRQSLDSINAQNQVLSGRLETLQNLYKSGRISSANYKIGLNDINQAFRNLDSAATSLDNQAKLDQANTIKATIDTSAALVTILTAGFGKAASTALTTEGLAPQELHGAADWLASKGMDITFKPVENALNKIAMDGQAFKVLTPEVQNAMQRATAEVVGASTSAMSAGQIARATAVNLALKYPIYFNYLSGTGEQIYHEMATGNDKGALKTIGFNALLLLSGGPIGNALKWGGKVASAATSATFGKTAFWDELGKFYGKDAVDIVANKAGAPTADFRQAVDQLRAAVENPGDNQKLINSLSKESQAHLASFTPETFKNFVQNLSAAEATNMAAVGNHDAVAAAYRVAQGMVNQRGFNDLTHVSHAEGLMDMSRMAKNQRIADELGKAHGSGPLSVGVIDNRTLGVIAKSNVVEGRTIAERDANWTAWKQANTSYAPANNPNFDKQMKNINRLRSKQARQEAIADINASKSAFTPKNLSKAEMAKVAQMSKEGFVIIQPTNIEAPFKEGAGKLSTAFSKDDEFFVRASQPLPVLGHMGGALTKLGLSPEAAQQQVYQVLNENFAKNLESLPVAQKLVDRLSKPTEARIIPGETRTIAGGTTGAMVPKGIKDERIKQIYQSEASYDDKVLNRRAGGSVKAAAYRALALQRRLDGTPTSIEFMNASKELDRNFVGKKVAQGEVVGTSFGKIRIKIAGGEVKSFDKEAIKSPKPTRAEVISKLKTDAEKEINSRAALAKQLPAKATSATATTTVTTAPTIIPGRTPRMTGNVTDYILKKLQQTKTKIPVRDYRMYTSKQISEALDVTRSEAIDIQNAISRSFLQTPMAIRGLGDKLVDLGYATRPTRAVVSRFTKIQGALRFAWNPFFTLGRLPFKTEALTEAEGGGFLRSVFTGRVGEIDKIRTELRSRGALNETGNFGVLSGEAVDMAGTLGSLGRDVTPLEEAGGVKEEVQANLGKKLTPMQERSIAGLIDSQATRMGLDWKTYINQEPQAVRDTVQMIAEYDKKSNFINSPLARTLNVAFFPFRFDVKVATIFARNLGKTDLLTQVAVVNGLIKAKTWLDSTEGQVWYSQNAEAIGLFKYLTPVASLNEIMQSLLPGHDHHLGNFGELGGLPFGWIPQLTDAEGWTHFNAPGVDAKTGVAFPKYIPNDTKGQAAVAIEDLVGALYSYPGATVGLPSKGSVNRTIGNALTTASTKADFTKITTPLDVSQQSKDYSATIAQMAGTTPATLSQQPPVAQAPGTPVPPSAPPNPLPRKVPGSGSSRTTKKKKADFTPQLLPGQSVLGQL